MKKILELGLETIQLDDQVLLVIGGQIPDNWYLDDANQIRKSVIDDPEYWEGRFGYKSIIASTKPLEGLPLLVIEDEVEILAEHSSEVQEATYTPPHKTTYKHGFMDGYNKAKETFKFTEEDLRRAIKMSKVTKKYKYGEGRVFVNSDESIIQSINKKELWIEVEFKETKSSVFRENDNAPYGIYEPKIINNQIKGIYR